MRSSFAPLLFATLCTTAAAQHVFVDVDGPASAFVGEAVTFVVRIDYDAAWFEEHGVAMSRQRLPLPVHVDVPWLRGASDRAVTWRAPQPDEPTMPIAVGDRVVSAWSLGEVDRDGRALRRVELRVRWLPRVAGSSPVEPVTLRYRYADEWTDDLLRGRQPVRREAGRAASQQRELMVQPLPTPAPDGFTGAVGAFSLDATSGGERVTVGSSFQIEVTVHGDGNVAEFAGLSQPKLDGFHVQGIAERRSDDAATRVFVLDLLALRAGVTEVPRVPFVAFSPKERDYVPLRSPAVPVVVDPVPDGVVLPPRVQALVDEDVRMRDLDHAFPWWGWLLGGFVLYGFGWKMLPILRERREQQERRRRLAALREAPWQDAQAVADAFQACVDVLPEPGDDVRALGDRLEAARFGGGMPERDDVLRVVAAALGA